MRKTVIISIISILIAIVSIVVYKATSATIKKSKQTSSAEMARTKMPLFEFQTLDSVPFSKYDLTKNKATIIVYFDPDCELCEKSADIFKTFEKVHKQTNVLFISHNTIAKIKKYQEHFGLNHIPNIKFFQCNEEQFYHQFKESKTPSYFIYNTNQKLVKIINDDIPVKVILRYIKAAQIDA